MRFFGYHAKEMARRVLPAQLFRIRRKLMKRLADRTREAEKSKAIARHGTFGPDLLCDSLKSSGIQQGNVLLVQSSFGRFNNFNGDAAFEKAGDNTLCMTGESNYEPL